MITLTKKAWLNGSVQLREQADPSIASISLHMGTGVFDGMMAYWNDDRHYVHWDVEHLQRFRANAQRMRLVFPWSVEAMQAGTQELLQEVQGATVYVRPIAFRSPPQLLLTGSERLPADVCIFGVHAQRDMDTELRCHISPVERVSGRAMPVAAKVCGLYVNSYECRRMAEEAGFDDGIMLDREGRIAEASAANVLFLRGGQVCTPRLTPDVFPGITRQIVLRIARELGLETVERDIFVAELEQFEAAFLCATLMELRAIGLIGSVHYSTSTHPAYRALLDGFRRITHGRT
jgi:branched-chain amino acid aminotransferase